MTSMSAIRPSLIKSVNPPPGEQDEGDKDELMDDAQEVEMAEVDEGDVADVEAEWADVPVAAMADSDGEENRVLAELDVPEPPDPVGQPRDRRGRRARRGAGDAEEPVDVKNPSNERIPESLRSPIKPSAEAVRSHNITHYPYRCWCPPCVEAKGKEAPHVRGANEPDADDRGAIATVSLDYNEPDAEGDLKVRTIVGKDEATGNVLHHKVICKGIGDEWAIKKVTKDLEEFGRRDVILKTDGEPAIVNVQAKIQAGRDGRTIPRNPPVYDPKSNGPCEKAVQDVTAHARTLKLALESRIKTGIPENSPAMEWIIEHSAYLTNKFSVGHDGMTPHERLTGQKWRRPLVEIGELVHAKLVVKNKKKGAVKKNKKKFAARSILAVWIGQVARTGEHVVAKQNGDVLKCRTIRRVPEEDRWDAKRILDIKGTPRRPAPSRRDAENLDARLIDDEATERHRPELLPRGAAEPADQPSGAHLQQPEARDRDQDIREMRITDNILEQFGGEDRYTLGCPGCQHKMLGLPGHRGHTSECRKRLYDAMQESEKGRAILDGNRERMHRRADEASRGQGAAAGNAAPREVSRQAGGGGARDAAMDVDAAAEPREPHEPNTTTTATPRTPRFGQADPQPEPEFRAEDDGDAIMDDDAIPDLEDSDDEDENEASKRSIEEALFGKSDDEDEKDQPNAKKQRLRVLGGDCNIFVHDENGNNLNFDTLMNITAINSALVRRSNPHTVTARTMGGILEFDETPEILKLDPEARDRVEVASQMDECLRQLRAVQDLVQVREIIRNLESSFRAPKNTKRKPMNNDGKLDVAEVYSPTRVTGMAEKFNLRPGWALDLTMNDPDDGTPWDFSIPEKREKVKKMLKRDEPFFLIVSPMCGPFSTLQNFNYSNMDSNDVMRKLAEAMLHVEFAVELCIAQHLAGRLFMFEHPVAASSWASEALEVLGGLEGVLKANFDFCVLGMRVGDKIRADERPHPVKKRTKVMTNSSMLHTLLIEAQCRGRHEYHADISNGKASECQEYPELFCKIICEAIKREADTIEWRNRTCKQHDISHVFEKLMALQKKTEELVMPPEEDHITHLYEGLEFVDDVTGAPLDKNKAIQARRLEIEYFREMGVYTKMKWEPWMKVITTRWLDVNKGDELSPNYRARLVGREIKTDKRMDLFAATPPLESLRMILSICAQHQSSYDTADNFILMSNDVKRAYFHAPATRPVFIKIPEEDLEPGDECRVGQLNLSLYGTRDAAMNWAKRFTTFLEGIGFVTGSASPCNFHHPKHNISTTVHGDDFTSTGTERDLQWLDKKLRTEFEIKTEFLGPAEHHAQQVRILNRVIEWGARGLTYEADQRHVEIIIRELNLEGGKATATPGTRDDAANGSSMYEEDINLRLNGEGDEKDEALQGKELTKFRALSARLNYLAQDRPDLQYAVKEVARRMACPTQGDWALMKRVARYLLGAPRAVQEFTWQELQTRFDTFVDSDWAGCKTSCRSTSGGVAKIGWHSIRSWSTTQATVAMSSAEAELYALTKGAAHTLGFMALAQDLGYSFNAMIHTDASAALGIVHRKGLGKLRHISVQYLWVQDRLKHGDFDVCKVPGKANPADLLTKHLPIHEVLVHMEHLGFRTSRTRAALAPQLSMMGPECENNGRDDWQEVGNEVIREHRCPRSSLFTPLRVNGAPPARALTAARVTRGKFLDSGQTFERRDNWTARGTAHLQLNRQWVGTTTFLRRSDDGFAVI